MAQQGRNNNDPAAARERRRLEAMDKVLDFLPRQELLKARFISQDWNRQIISHRNLPSVKVGKDWEDKHRATTSFNNLQRAVNFTLDNIIIQRGKDTLFWNTFWPIMEANLVSLTLKNVTLVCHRMAEVVNHCLRLETLVLEDIKFESRAMLENPNPAHRTFCIHFGIDDFPAEDRQPASIKKLVLRDLKYGILPTCLATMLASRSQGHLQEFEWTNNSYTVEARMNMTPTVEQVHGSIYEILRVNDGILRKLTVDRSTLGNELLIPGIQREGAQPLHLQHLKLAQRGQQHPRQAPHNHQDTSIQFIEFIRQQQLLAPIQTLDLSFVQTREIPLLHELLPTLTQLKKLTLTMGFADSTLRLNYLHNLQHLKELVVIEKFVPKIVVEAALQGIDPIDHTYLMNLPASIRKLTFDHDTFRGMPPELIPNALSAPNLAQLTKLVIVQGKYFNDNMMQVLIENLRELVELTINDSTFLTDSGLTGLEPNLIGLILSKKAFYLLKNAEVMMPNRTGRSLTQLNRLHKLNLKGCKKISDISLYQDIQSPHLVEVNFTYLINVSDLGLVWLCERNPKLERIVCKNNRKVTHFGLNMLIMKHLNLINIHTNKECVTRKIGNLDYQPHERVGRVLTVAKWNEVK